MKEPAAIMMTDIVGFTELTRQRDEFIRKISRKHKRVIQEVVSRYNGRIIHIFGDSSLSIFPEPADAVKCAIELQQSFSEEPVIPLRIALHHGPVTLEGDEIFGEALNLASRILKIAIKNSILLSDKINQLLSPEYGIRTVSTGIYNLKYVDHPVEIFGVHEGDLVLPEPSPEDRGETIQSNTIAVLPFVNLTGDKENEYLSDGISEAIINTLAQSEGLFVTARSSSFAFKGQGKDVRELGKLLGVANILEGSVQKHENKIRVTAQLINTTTGFHVFSETVEKELLDLFSIQEEIAWLINGKLKEKISQQKGDQTSVPRATSVKALDLGMQARYKMSSGIESEIREAMDMLRKAIEIDPGFILLYTGMSMCYTYLGALRLMDEEQAYRRANEYALKALEMDPNLPEAMIGHTISSFWMSNWNLKNTESIISKALKLAPGSAEVRLFNGMFTLMAGKPEEALIEVLLANKLDPLNPNILSRLGYTYLCLKDFDEAHTCFRLAHDTAPFAMYIHYILAWSYILQEKYDQAANALRLVDEKKDVYQSLNGTLGYLYTKQGKPDKAYEQIQVINRLKEKGTIRYPDYNLTLVYAGLNKPDEMYYHMEKAFLEKPVHLMFVQADPFWEKFRQDKRYKVLMKKVFQRSAPTELLTLFADTSESLTVRSDQILYISAEDNYSRIIYLDGNNRKEKVLRATLKNLEEQLAGTDIIRCHRSYLFNASRYSLSGDSRGYSLKSSDDLFEIPVARLKSKEIIIRLKE